MDVSALENNYNRQWFTLYTIVMITYMAIMGYILGSGDNNKNLIMILYTLACVLIIISCVLFWLEMESKKLFFTILCTMMSAVLLFEIYRYSVQVGNVNNEFIYYGTYIIQVIVLFISVISMYKSIYS
jgi:CHASE2 domain-containing sensor protein